MKDAMDRELATFQHLDHFLNAYMHQDWDLFSESLSDVVHTYIAETSVGDAARLRSEIDEFISMHGLDLDAAFYRLFPNSALPSGWNMSVEQWLQQVSQITEAARPEHV
jgi:hypothetical protein